MKAFVITLSDSSISNRLAEDCILAANNFNLEAYKWSAVNGDIDGKNKMQSYDIPLFHTFPNCPGVIGCFLSHFELWMHSVALNESIVILEHDGLFIRPLPEDVELMYTDVLYLDPYIPTARNYSEQIIDSLNISDISTFYAEASGSSVSGDFVNGAYAYCIKPHAAKKLIDFAKKFGANPADVHIGREVVDLRTTTVSFARLHPFYDIDHIHKYSSTARLQTFLESNDH